MCFAGAGQPLFARRRPVPVPRAGELLIRVHACGVCRTDLHLLDGELAEPSPQVVPGHEIVGTVVDAGAQATRFNPGDLIGVPWLGWTCGACRYCRSGRENLCDAARFTGYTIDGGYADYATADERYCFALPAGYSDVEAAPLLCAGLIGYRALRAAGEARTLGIYGFGAAAHIVAQVARHEGRTVFALTRPGDAAAQDFARGLGAAWAGGSDAAPPEPLDAALVFAPAGALVPEALGRLAKGGTVVCAGIHMSAIPAFDYALRDRCDSAFTPQPHACRWRSLPRPRTAHSCPHGDAGVSAGPCQRGACGAARRAPVGRRGTYDALAPRSRASWQARQRTAAGELARRRHGIAVPQETQVPYSPASRRASACCTASNSCQSRPSSASATPAACRPAGRSSDAAADIDRVAFARSASISLSSAL
jgi:propanol-preferring alcohol dehydrogenase